MKLLYFAWLRARIGQAEEEVPLPAEVRDVAGLLEWLRGRGPRYAEALARSVGDPGRGQPGLCRAPSIRCARGDEIAMFPPVTGG